MSHMVNAMNKAMKDCIPDITILFLDDILVKGCLDDQKDETVCDDGYRKFVADHISDCEKIMQKLEGARVTFSREQSTFGQLKFLVVGHLCRPYDQKPSPAKV